jgi:TrmH family RNA methyltransferase
MKNDKVSLMIPLHKLKELPRSLRLRKAASLFSAAERRLVLLGKLPDREAEYLGSVVELLVNDEKIAEAPREALKNARFTLVGTGVDGKEIRRALNTVHHIILNETGRTQADWDFVEASGAMDSSKRRPFACMWVYLEDIRSPFNVGSMFRAAESFGAEKLWLSPLCADPRHKRAERTAMGCVDVLPWERFPHDPFAKLDESGSPVLLFEGPFFALETGGIPLADFSFPSRGVLIVGSEELGVSPRALAAADASLGRVTIPTWGAKGSLNVSVAFGIVMQAWASALNDDLPSGTVHK